MATSFKYLDTNDRVVSTTNLTEQTTLTQTSLWTSSDKTYFAKLSSGSLATHIADVSYGRSTETTGTSTDFSKQQSMYNQMAKVLLGHDENGNILKFSIDNDSSAGNNILHNAYFVNFSRSQFKDKIKTGTFSMSLAVSGTTSITLEEKLVNSQYPTHECQTGLYGPLFVTTASGDSAKFNIASGVNDVQGLIFYEAGIAVISPYIFAQKAAFPNPSGSNTYLSGNVFGILSGGPTSSLSGTVGVRDLLSGSLIADSAYGLHHNVSSISFQPTTELNSTIYFCRAYNNEFNFSSNPTYLKDSEIVVKGGDPLAQPVSYITTVGLYDDKDQLLAVAKLSEPVKKTPDTELIARVRLDF